MHFIIISQYIINQQKNYIGADYFFESIINDMSDCKYDEGARRFEEDIKREPYKYENKQSK